MGSAGFIPSTVTSGSLLRSSGGLMGLSALASEPGGSDIFRGVSGFRGLGVLGVQGLSLDLEGFGV